MRQQNGRALRGALAAMPQRANRAAPALQRLSPGVYRSASGQLVGQNGRPLPGQQRNNTQQVTPGRGQGIPSDVIQGVAQGIGGQLGGQPGFSDKMYRFPPGSYNPGAMAQAIGGAAGAMSGQMNPQGMQLGNYMAQPQERLYQSQGMSGQAQGAMNYFMGQPQQMPFQPEQQAPEGVNPELYKTTLAAQQGAYDMQRMQQMSPQQLQQMKMQNPNRFGPMS